MTPANVKRIKEIAEHFRTLAEENPDAATAMYAILKAQNILTNVMTDLHFRPEVNS